MLEQKPEQQQQSEVDDHEKIKKPLVIIILSTSFFVFLISALGVLENIDKWVTQLLIEGLGYTNAWSKTYGPEWLSKLSTDVSAFGGEVFLVLALLIIGGYYFFKGDKRRMWRFFVIIIGGGFFLMIMKAFFEIEIPTFEDDKVFMTIASYPSGHAMMSTIFYLSTAIYLTRKERGSDLRHYYMLLAVFMILIIGISRVLLGNHEPSEVLAGWSLGLIWLCLYWLMERFVRKKGW